MTFGENVDRRIIPRADTAPGENNNTGRGCFYEKTVIAACYQDVCGLAQTLVRTKLMP